MARKGGRGSGAEINKACASCKVRRQVCDPEKCPMAPYFPMDRLNEFKKARSVFGVKNIQSMLEWVQPGWQRQAAAESIMYSAVARKDDPIGGCFAILRQLKKDVEAAEEALNATKAALNDCRKTNQDYPSKDKASSSGCKEGENPKDYPTKLETVDEEMEQFRQEILIARRFPEASTSKGKQLMAKEETELNEDKHDDKDDDENDYDDNEDEEEEKE